MEVDITITVCFGIMSPNGGGNPSGALAEAIDSAFGSSRDLKILFRKRQQRDLVQDGLGCVCKEESLKYVQP